MTRFEKINVFNILLTLFLSAIAVFLSYNSYRTSENTFELSRQIAKINNDQSANQLQSAASSLVTTISIQRQNDSESKDLKTSIATLNKLKEILQSQLGNLFLAQNEDLSELWVSM